jgi:hypothetical protein
MVEKHPQRVDTGQAEVIMIMCDDEGRSGARQIAATTRWRLAVPSSSHTLGT